MFSFVSPPLVPPLTPLEAVFLSSGGALLRAVVLIALTPASGQKVTFFESESVCVVQKPCPREC